MSPTRPARRPLVGIVTALALALALTLVFAVALAACGGPAPSPGAQASGPLVSPVTGRLTRIDAAALTRVKGFTMRLSDGSEVAFVVGTLENGGQFPPGHLAEHMASSSAVKVFFRDEGGAHVVYRLEDGE